MKKRKNQTRRSAAEWADVVRAWRRSGETAATYARGRNFKSATLSGWTWKLTRDGVVERPGGEVDLVEVAVVDDATQPEAGWELTTSDGHLLRGSAAMSVELAEALVRALVEDR